ncbi:hypothetical protein DSO57_1004977 [Entomophthora muscae]|uniref:Uncharacterized protein n=1 Tax=Entomophthora muscae TaxID=34485 RepID=A0ACC2U6Y1_9FUNG|nr:hypothetical protein DSO57_1004977 [Entomophthora muscae]
MGEKEIASSHEDQPQGSSVLATYFNIVCLTAGVGILGLPQSVAQGGWVSILFIVVSAIMSIYTSLLLIQCLYAPKDRKLHTYPEIGYEAFGSIGQYTIQTCHYTILLGMATLCILLSGKNLVAILGALGWKVKLEIMIVISGLLIGIPYCLLRTIKEFVWMAVFGVLTTVGTLIIVVVFALVELPLVSPSLAIKEDVVWGGLPTSLAVFSLAYAGNIVHPHFEGAMKSPKKWPTALFLGLGTVCSLYILMGIVGYYVYGNSAEEIILDNLKAVIPANISRGLITVHVLMTGPILLCSFGVEIEDKFGISSGTMGTYKTTFSRIISRAVTIVILTIIAMVIPYFMAIMGIIGSFFNCLNLFHFPIFCHVKLFGLRGRSLLEYTVMTVTLVVATICFFWGGYGSIASMVDAVKGSK